MIVYTYIHVHTGIYIYNVTGYYTLRYSTGTITMQIAVSTWRRYYSIYIYIHVYIYTGTGIVCLKHERPKMNSIGKFQFQVPTGPVRKGKREPVLSMYGENG
jgi:hypothetical protein